MEMSDEDFDLLPEFLENAESMSFIRKLCSLNIKYLFCESMFKTKLFLQFR